jgi:ribonucleotide monophosphatase NagD (HAD superfamily)
MCAAISLSTGKEPKYVGKPFKETVDMVLALTKAELESTAFVGDRLYTDVKTGVQNGAKGILVLSGETKEEDLKGADVVPDGIFTGLDEMKEILREL